MSEKGGLDGIWEDINKKLVVNVKTYEDNQPNSDLPLVTEFTVTNEDKVSDNTPEVFFQKVILKVGVPPNLHIEKHTNLARGESFTYKHRSRYGDLGKITYSLDGTVSPTRLLQIKRREFDIPYIRASLPFSSYVEVLKDMNIHKWINDPIKNMMIPTSDTTEAEIKAQQNRFKNAENEIDDTKKHLDKIFQFIIKPTDSDRVKMNQNKKQLEDYLAHIDQALSELRKMLDTYNAKTIEATRNKHIISLTQEAVNIDQASVGLLG